VARQKKVRKVGRPKLPKGEAMGRIVPVRFAPDDLRAMEAKAKAAKLSLSEWIRSTIHGAI
jgi:predicted HicB family RNase H-like nuclease